MRIIHADKLLWKWLTFPIKDVSFTMGGRCGMGKDFFSFFQSSPDLLMCVMLPATGKKKKDRRKIGYTFTSEMRQTNNRVCLFVCLFDCPVQLQHVYVFCIGTDTTEVGGGVWEGGG